MRSIALKRPAIVASLTLMSAIDPTFAAPKAMPDGAMDWPLMGKQPEPTMKVAVDWPAFMARQDLIWERLPARWNDGAFTGNGLLGTMIWRDGNALRLEIGRTDLTQIGMRLPIGQLLLQPRGQLQGGTARLDLYNAEARGVLETDQGRIAWRVFTHANDEATLLEWRGEGGETAATIQLTPAVAANPRKVFRKEALTPEETNSTAETGADGAFNFARQDLTGGGGFATVWTDVTINDLHRVFLTTQKGADGRTAAKAAQSVLGKTVKTDFTRWENAHRDWWHNYFQQSFLSVPDSRMENFYWIQLYKLASGTRSGRPMLDLMGPWFRGTPWPRIWWNLNTQLTYWPVYASNHLDIGESLPQMLHANTQNLIQNAPEPFRSDSAVINRSSSYDGVSPISPAYGLSPAERNAALPTQPDSLRELGNLTWALHNVWLQYRYSMDDRLARETLYPLLRRSVNLYLHLLEPGEDGYLHLPLTFSPEYKPARDATYDLALLRWGVQTLPLLAQRLKIKDPLLPKWQEVEQKLAPYATGPDGLMIGRDVPLSSSHRHFSHLLMFYPLHTLSTDVLENRALLEKSVNHWLGFKGALQGYSYTGGAAMMAGLGRGEDAEKYLNSFLNSFVQPNTMYLESGPVIETPLSAAASLQEMLLQSWGNGFDNTIRVFPAVPASWKDAAFHNMRAEGAFLVSAARHEGQTSWIQIQSLAGEPLKVKLGPGQWNFRGKKPIKYHPAETDDVVSIDLAKGESILILRYGAEADLTLAPVAHETANSYGLKAQAPAP